MTTTFLHWYMTGFFVLFGLWLLKNRACFARISGFLRTSDIPEPYAERLSDAIERRERIERLPNAALATWIASASLAAALAGVVTPVPVTILYAGVALVLAGTLGIGYVRLRRAGGRRVASLRPRARTSTVPVWFSAAVAVTAVSPLAFIDVVPLAALGVTVASVAIALVGEAVARLPALLGGDDPVVDAYVDDQLRSVRAVNIIGTATAPAYVFDSVTATTTVNGFTGLHGIVFAAALLGLLVSTGWLLALIRRPAAPDFDAWGRSRA